MSGIMIAAPKSGSGKTMVTCGLLTLLQRRGLRPSAFKCGPDYIDGLFHRKVLGVDSGHLDLFFEEREQMRARFGRYSEGKFAVAEGAMGYYDGLGGLSLRASAWETADALKLPVILVVDAHGAGLSLAAQIQGFVNFDTGSPPPNGIAGIIFNRLSPGMYGPMKAAVEERAGVPVVGYVPVLDFLKVDSRHLGLVLPGEIRGLRGQMEQLADCLETSLDVERILEIGGKNAGTEENVQAPGIWDRAPDRREPEAKVQKPPSRFRLGVAMDEAFCFYYRENLEAMEEAGARLVYFSPLRDRELPPDLGGMILGGGYPENHAEELCENRSMRRAVREVSRAGMPILGECGGYLYLLRELEGADGRTYPMAGVFEGMGRPVGRSPRFGYITVTCSRELPFLEEGGSIRAHEFHYWDCSCREEEYVMRAVKPVGGRSWPCMRTSGRTVAGFPHLYYGSCPQWVQRFAEACMEYRRM